MPSDAASGGGYRRNPRKYQKARPRPRKRPFVLRGPRSQAYTKQERRQVTRFKRTPHYKRSKRIARYEGGRPVSAGGGKVKFKTVGGKPRVLTRKQYNRELALRNARSVYKPGLGRVDEAFEKAQLKAEAKVYKSLLKMPDKVRERELPKLYARRVRRYKEREFENADDKTRQKFGLPKKDKDLKVAGVNVDAITGAAGRKAGGGAIALLEEVSRPFYGVAGGAYAGVAGKNVLRGASRGYRGVEKKTFSDVLKKAGYKGPGAGVLGFGLDVALDPVTYLTLGAGNIAKKTGEKVLVKKMAERTAARKAGTLKPPKLKQTAPGSREGEKTYRRALAEGLSMQEAGAAARAARAKVDEARQASRASTLDKRAARRAAKKAEAKAPAGRGIQVGLSGYGKRVSTTGRSLPLRKPVIVKREPGKVRTRVRVRAAKVGAGARSFGGDFSPHIKPIHTTEKEFSTIKGGEREARNAVTRGRKRAVARAAAFARAIPLARAADVIDAIERGTVYTLPKELQAPARAIEREFKMARKAEIRAGIQTAEVSGPRYFTHALKDILDEGTQTVGRPAKGAGKEGYTKQRQWRGTIRQIEEAGGPEFSRNIPKVVADRLARSATDVARANLGRTILEAGRTIKPGSGPVKLKEGEAVFEVSGKNITALDLSDQEAQKLLGRITSGKEVPKHRKYVVANKDFIEDRLKSVTPAARSSIGGRAFDKTTGGWKFAATVVNPGFHARNMAGDTWNAYLGQSLGGTLKNAVTGGRALKRIKAAEEGARTVAGTPKKRLLPEVLPDTVKIKDKYGRTQTVTLEQLAKRAERAGAIRGGYFGREIPELWGGAEGKVKAVRVGKAARAGRGVKRTLDNREDLMRMSTFISGLKEGLSDREAAAKVARQLFDYGDLSAVERRGARRLMPFYTWSARNIPLQGKSIVQRPGKYANFEKARVEIAKAQGIDLDKWQDENLKEYQRRMAPIPIKRNGQIYAVSTSLPLTDLESVPLPRNGLLGARQLNVWGDKFAQLLSPIIRTPVELKANYNFFFKSDIESENAPLVAAPAFVSKLPDSLKRASGAVPDYIDKRTGKKGWGWNAKWDYAAKVLAPGPGGAALALTTEGTSRRGQNKGAKALSYFGGVKSDPTGRVGEPTVEPKIERLFNERTKLIKQRAALSQRGQGSARSGKRETKAYVKVRDRLKEVEGAITAASAKRGDAKPLFQRGKAKGSSGGGDFWNLDGPKKKVRPKSGGNDDFWKLD